MLSFILIGHKEKSNPRKLVRSSSESPSTSVHKNLNKTTSYSFDTAQTGPLSSYDDDSLFELGTSVTLKFPIRILIFVFFLITGDKEIVKEQSKLSKTLHDVLHDKAALGYFIQYLEIYGGLQFVRCWLDIENFKEALSSCEYRDKEDGVTNINETNKLSPLPSTKIDHDSLSVSTDCDSYTADTNSLCDCSVSTLSDGKVGSTDIKSEPIEKNKLEINTFCDRNVSDTSPSGRNLNKSKSSDNAKVFNGQFVQEFIDDALRIFKKYVALEAIEPIKCPEVHRKEVIENICSGEKILKANCFEKVQKFAYDMLEKEYFEAFINSDYFCKYQIDLLTSGNVVLEDILYNETALFYFIEFIEQETSNGNLLEFWIAATNFHKQLQDQKEFFDPVVAQNDAVVLYDKYFSLQAHCPLGFGDKVRFAVEQNICGENGLTMDCFELPVKIIEKILEKNYLKPFLASQLFYKYLSELINAVQCNGYSTLYTKNKSLPSDCSSEKSFSTQSTFLAMEMPKRKLKKEQGTNMDIDTRELYDPDALWKRKKYHRLSFGRITELGKFETDIEPEPDKKGESKLRNVVKKFVTFDEDKTKEEMAWQVAEMIVKDITNITLNEQKVYNS